jgi:hypothetical protein
VSLTSNPSSPVVFCVFASLVCGCGASQAQRERPTTELSYRPMAATDSARTQGVVVLSEPVSETAARKWVERFYAAIVDENIVALGELLSRDAGFLVVRPSNGGAPGSLSSMMGAPPSLAGSAQSVGSILDWYRVRMQALDFSKARSDTLIRSVSVVEDVSVPTGFPKAPREPGDLIVRVALDLPWDVSENLFAGSETHLFHIVRRDERLQITDHAFETKP